MTTKIINSAEKENILKQEDFFLLFLNKNSLLNKTALELYDNIAKEFGLDMFVINVGEGWTTEIVKKYNIPMLPYFLFISKGTVKFSNIGLTTKIQVGKSMLNRGI